MSALADYSGCRAALYARLKLAGLDEAPEQLAVFAEGDPAQGHGLGRRSMPETLLYSTVCAVHTLWLAARAARSEEHTSELQSLMRISYAVFCLKKNKSIQKHNRIVV